MLNIKLVSLLLTAVIINNCNGDWQKVIPETLKQQLTIKNPTTKNELILLKDAQLEKDSQSFVWRAQCKGESVIAKILPIQDEYTANKEYLVNAALKSIGNDSARAYGIPKVHFYGQHRFGDIDCDVVATDLLESKFDSIIGRNRLGLTPVDSLYIYRLVVRSLKYMHGKKVIHNYITPSNMFLNGVRIFFTELTAATLLEKNIIGTHGDWYYCSYNHKLNKTRYERDDLEAANNVMTFITTGRIPWLTRNDPKEDMEKKRKTLYSYVRDSKVKDAYKKISKIIYVDNQRMYDEEYDEIDRILVEAIHKINGDKPLTLSWITPAKQFMITEVENELKNNPIHEIRGPGPRPSEKPGLLQKAAANIRRISHVN